MSRREKARRVWGGVAAGALAAVVTALPAHAQQPTPGPEPPASAEAPADWLLTAMETEPANASANESRDASRGRHDGNVTKPKRGAREEPSLPSGAPNPLATYLAEWITPADRSLLLPESAPAAGGGTTSRPAAPGAGTATANPFIAAMEAAAHTSAGETAPAKAMAAPAVTAEARLSDEPGLRPAPAAPGLTAPASDANSATRPPAWQPAPSSERKYFPQLKPF